MKHVILHLSVVLLALCVGSSARASDGLERFRSEQECLPTWPHTAREYVSTITAGWRPLTQRRGWRGGWVDELHNVRVIYDTFKQAGYSDAIAYTAIVNAFEESKLDNHVVMQRPFRYFSRFYPRGTGAIGLFQLLPMKVGAGGPSGIAEGYSRDFMGRRWAGTARQARRYSHTPDAEGRTYYDASNPRINAARIVLEVERDGANLLRADRAGRPIVDLVYLFARDIERPSGNVFKRRDRARKMLGDALANAWQPNLMFPSDPIPELPESSEVVEPPTCEQPAPSEQLAVVDASAAMPSSWLLLAMLGAWRGH